MLELLDERGEPGWNLQLPALPLERDISLWVDGEVWILTQWNREDEVAGIHSGRIGTSTWHFDLDGEERDGEDRDLQVRDGEKAWNKPAAAPWRLEITKKSGRAENPWRPWRKGILRRPLGTSLVQLFGPQGEEGRFITAGRVYCLQADNDFHRLCLVHNGGGRKGALGVWEFDGNTGRFTPRVATGAGYRFSFDNGAMLLFTEEPAEQRLLRIAVGEPLPLVIRTRGNAFSELQLLGDTIYGLRPVGETMAVVRLDLTDEDGS